MASSWQLDGAICAALILLIFAVYGRVIDFNFINFDDPAYVTANSHVRAGLTLDNIRWAFTAVVASNWMPVTLISHMLDCELFGVASGKQHLVNVLFHALSSVLLYLALKRATRMLWPSAFVAFVFALHPLHVESVAWIAERKDVLSALFWFLALYCYIIYCERPNLRRYLLVVALFALGLMSKPMLVTFPFTLLLLDYWPLRRLKWPRILLEKLPLFALSAAASVETYFVQGSTGAFELRIPLGMRIENALISYLTYIIQLFAPVRLAILYSYPKSLSHGYGALAAIIILGISALVILTWRTRPYYAVGWFWYLGTMVPVIGLVQVGFQSHADRYMYVPMVGLLVMLAWGAVDAVQCWPSIKPAIAPAAAIACVACVILSWMQISYWRDSGTLFQHAVDVTEDNWMAEGSLGGYLLSQPGRRGDAVEYLQAALRANPEYADAQSNLGLCLLDAGLYGDAMRHFETAIRLKPEWSEPRNNLGLCLLSMGKYADAIAAFQDALRAKPDSPEIRVHLSMVLSKIPGRETEAIPYLQEAIRLKPDYADAYFSLGLLLASLGRTEEAISQIEAGQRLNPTAAAAQALEHLRNHQPI